MTCFARKTIAGKGIRRLNLSIALVVPEEKTLAISDDGINFCFGCKLTFRTFLIRLITGIILMKLPKLLVGTNGLKNTRKPISGEKRSKKESI
jgi:hypothetical protein